MPAGFSFCPESTGCGWCSFLLLDDTGINVGSIRNGTATFKKYRKSTKKIERKYLHLCRKVV
nr:MAG TPA: hypothetical protein [Caudoviricetes sp.]